MAQTVNFTSSTYSYYDDGLLHRDDGPALIFTKSGNTEYWQHGKKHRLDGPADISVHGSVWWINGHCVDTAIRKWAKYMNIDLDNLSDEDKIMIQIKWSDYNG